MYTVKMDSPWSITMKPPSKKKSRAMTTRPELAAVISVPIAAESSELGLLFGFAFAA